MEVEEIMQYVFMKYRNPVLQASLYMPRKCLPSPAPNAGSYLRLPLCKYERLAKEVHFESPEENFVVNYGEES